MQIRKYVEIAIGVLISAIAISCSPCLAQNVQTYCAKVGNDDRVQPIPDALIPAARRMFEVTADTSDSFVQATTSARCMDGTTLLCSYGANLICEKADVERNSYGGDRFCKQNPGSTSIPMSATGHATIFEWKCVGQEARVVRETTQVDARGFIAENWKPIE
jgi:hypothetical protein